MVLIKDMGLPSSCATCRLHDARYYECRVMWKSVSDYHLKECRPKWCPLTEVVAYGPEGTLYKEK